MTVSTNILNSEDPSWQMSQVVSAIQRLDRRIAELDLNTPKSDANLLDMPKRAQARRNLGIPDGSVEGDALLWDGSRWGIGSLPNRFVNELTEVELTSGSTWTVPPAATFCWVICRGPGGGGGSGFELGYAALTSGGDATRLLNQSGGGGGGGGTIIAPYLLDASTIPTATIAIGSGGAGGAAGGADGSSGSSDTTFSYDGYPIRAGRGFGGKYGGMGGGSGTTQGPLGTDRLTMAFRGGNGMSGFIKTGFSAIEAGALGGWPNGGSGAFHDEPGVGGSAGFIKIYHNG